MIKPLVIKTITFPNNLIQGPLAGISSAPFRLLTSDQSHPAFSCTEMISAKTLIHGSPASHRRFVEKHPDEGPVCFQLSGNNPHELSEATKRVTDYGADLIDLNCGCPVKKIRSKRAGSYLLSDASKLYQLIVAMKQSTDKPVSIKIRIDGASKEKFNEEMVKVVNDAGCDFLVVHGRHWTEHYETPCRYDDIRFFVDRLTIPVIGNGDVACLKSLEAMLSTGCAGAMIGRAGVGQPWLIRKLITEMRGEPFHLPSQKEIGMMFLNHVLYLEKLLSSEKFAIIQARKFAKYYARQMENKTAFCDAMNVCDDLIRLKAICAFYFV